MIRALTAKLWSFKVATNLWQMNCGYLKKHCYIPPGVYKHVFFWFDKIDDFWTFLKHMRLGFVFTEVWSARIATKVSETESMTSSRSKLILNLFAVFIWEKYRHVCNFTLEKVTLVRICLIHKGNPGKSLLFVGQPISNGANFLLRWS